MCERKDQKERRKKNHEDVKREIKTSVHLLFTFFTTLYLSLTSCAFLSNQNHFLSLHSCSSFLALPRFPKCCACDDCINFFITVTFSW